MAQGMNDSELEQKKYVPGTRVIDRRGVKFGRLTVEEHLGPRPHQVTQAHYWLCRCECGGSVEVSGVNIASKSVLSCGCYHVDQVRKATTTHGMTRTPTYSSWINMVNRCRYDYSCWPVYRDKTTCARWRDSFENFLADMGERPKGKTIDRIDGTQGYFCGKSECSECGPLGRIPNCRWATPSEQCRNVKSNLILEFDGERRPAVEWAEVTGLTASCIYSRKDLGFTDEMALTKPPRKGPKVDSRFTPEWEQRVARYWNEKRAKGH